MKTSVTIPSKSLFRKKEMICGGQNEVFVSAFALSEILSEQGERNWFLCFRYPERGFLEVESENGYSGRGDGDEELFGSGLRSLRM